jgi:quercetin dioxygenase-like cupin family protein
VSESNTEAKTSMRFVTMHEADASVVGGRRPYLDYLDQGVTEATDGWMRAEVMRVRAAPEPTGWHYHECEGQFCYLLKGWIRMEFEDGHVFDMKPGDSMFLPGGTIHNMAATSDEFESIEITIPAEIATIPVDKPAHLP